MDVKVQAPGIEKVRATIKNQQKTAKREEMEQEKKAKAAAQAVDA